MSPFRLFGSMAVALSALFLAVVIANWLSPARLHGGHDLTRMAAPCMMLMAIGFGTLLHQKWAATILCVVCVVVGGWYSCRSLRLCQYERMFLTCCSGLPSSHPELL